MTNRDNVERPAPVGPVPVTGQDLLDELYALLGGPGERSEFLADAALGIASRMRERGVLLLRTGDDQFREAWEGQLLDLRRLFWQAFGRPYCVDADAELRDVANDCGATREDLAGDS